jgi:tetratricopeptide (TPR) repeat protein
MGKKDKRKGNKQPSGADFDLAQLSKLKASKLFKSKKTVKEPQILTTNKVDWKWLGLACLSISLIVILLFANTIVAKPIFNDYHTLSLFGTLNNWTEFWLSVWSDLFIRPLSQPWLRISYALDLKNYGNAFVWYHAVNVFLHLLSCLYLFSFVFWFARVLEAQKRISIEPKYLALLSAAIFACHPFVTEAVAYVSQRQALLSTANILLALNFFLIAYLSTQKSIRFWYFLITLGASYMAVTTNVNAIGLPAIMLAIAFILKKPETSILSWLIERPMINGILIGCICISPCLVLLGLQFTPVHYSYMQIMSPITYVASELKAITTYYLRCLVFPIGLSIYPPFIEAASLFDPFAIIGALLLLLSVYSLYLLRKYPIVCLGFVLLLGALVPQLFFIKPEIVSDGIAYSAVLSVAIFFSFLFCTWSQKSSKFALASLLSIIVLFSSLTIWRNWEWRSELRILQSAARVNSNSPQVKALIALEFLKEGNNKEAEKIVGEARKAGTNISLLEQAYAKILFQQGKYSEAKTALDQAIKLAQEEHATKLYKAAIQLDLAETYIELHKPELAMSIIYANASDLTNNARAKYIIGKAWYEKKKYQQAIYFLDLALRQDASLYVCWEPLIKSALAMGLYKEAYQAAHMMDMQRSSDLSKILLARAAIACGIAKNAQDALENVLKNNPKNIEALVLLSYVEKILPDAKKEKMYKEQALALDKNAFSNYKFSELEKLTIDIKETGK